MAMKNRYSRNTKITETKFRLLIRLFASDLNASEISTVTGLNRNTVNRFLRAIREALVEQDEKESPINRGFELDELFYARYWEGHYTIGKTIITGVIKKNGTIYTIVDKDSPRIIKAIIKGEIKIESVFSGIYEDFINFSKKRLAKFRGIRAEDYYLHFKECEYRYNHRDEDLKKLLLVIFKDKALFTE